MPKHETPDNILNHLFQICSVQSLTLLSVFSLYLRMDGQTKKKTAKFNHILKLKKDSIIIQYNSKNNNKLTRTNIPLYKAVSYFGL